MTAPGTSDQDLVSLAIDNGWRWKRTRNGHQTLFPPRGTIDPHTGQEARPVFFPSTPSDWRGRKNLESHLRRLGLHIPRKGQTT